jgi:hypothetical protein
MIYHLCCPPPNLQYFGDDCDALAVSNSGSWVEFGSSFDVTKKGGNIDVDIVGYLMCNVILILMERLDGEFTVRHPHC